MPGIGGLEIETQLSPRQVTHWVCDVSAQNAGSAHGPNHPTVQPVNREVFSLSWAKPSVYATGAMLLLTFQMVYLDVFYELVNNQSL